MTEGFRTIAGTPVNPVGLGCMSLSWAYGSPPPDADGEALLSAALDMGYNAFDTARIYGDGHNETLVGRALAGRRNEFFLASKTGIIVEGQSRRVDCRPETIRAALDTSLRLLRTDCIDLYYLHRRDFDTPIEESVGALADAVAVGKIRAIGLSEMSADTLRRAHAVHPIAAMQSEYSPWTRNPEIAVLDACRELGTTLVAFSPVGRGVLAGGIADPAALPEVDIRRTNPRFVGEAWAHNRRLIAEFEGLARDAGVTPAQLALGWVLSRGDHVVAIPGTAQVAHARENIARWDWRPDAATIAAIDATVNERTVRGARYNRAMQRWIDTETFADEELEA